jgi:hypothetical protein
MPCTACNSTDVFPFLPIHSVPVFCNVLSTSPEQARAVPKGEVDLALCRDCGLVFNRAFHPSLLDYAAHYENALHFSPAFREYMEELATGLVTRHALRRKRITEIGAGDGYFLSALCTRGENQGTGYDPAFDPERSMLAPGAQATIVREMFRPETARDTDFVTCRHVLEHIPRPGEFLAQLRRSVHDGAGVYFEVPDGGYMLEHSAVWDVLYEHCSYFSPAALADLFERAGFGVRRTASAYHGQFLTIEAVAGEPSSHTPADEAPDRESVHRFAEFYRAKIELWRRRLERLVPAQVVLWGAGTKGVSFLNALGPASSAIHAVVDVNPRKWCSYTAGTGHEIVSPEKLTERGADVVILANPVYRAEVSDQLSSLGLCPELVVM